MRQYVIIAVVIMASLLQVTLLPGLRPFGVVPNLIVAIIAAIALTGPIVFSMALAIGAGIFLDSVSGADFGLRTGLLALAVILSAFARRSGLQVGIRVQLLSLVGIVCTFSALINIGEIIFSGGRIQIVTAISVWLGVVATTAVLGLIVGPSIARLAKPSGYGEVE